MVQKRQNVAPPRQAAPSRQRYKRATVYFMPELHTALRLKAAEAGCSISAVINSIISRSLADEAADLGVELRQLLYGKRRNVYRILFTIEGGTVNVLRIRHAAQDRLTPEDV